MRIHSLWLSGFRPFKEHIELSELNSVNIIIGPNNIGKSAILLALRRLGQKNFKDNTGRQPPPHPFLHDDKHDSGRPEDLSEIELRIGVSLSEEEHQKTVVGGIYPGPIGPKPERHVIYIKDNGSNASLLGDVSAYHTQPAAVAQRILQDLGKQFLYIPPLRVVGYKFEATDMHSRGERSDDGNNLLSDFLSWYLPDIESGNAQSAKMLRFQDLTKSMLGVSSVRAWPTPDQRIRVSINDEKPRNLDQMGSGISQVFAIASAIVSHQTPIILLEEPEVGLHPRLQRLLMTELTRLPEGQVFITSHSNHIIDTTDKSVNSYLIREVSTLRRNSRVAEQLKSDQRSALEVLGIRPSSVSLANALICVEGPSDAIYLRRWISLHERGSSLREYRDYAFIFTGGKTLKHFSSLEEGDAIVRLFKLHPHFYIIGDSDRNAEGSSINNSALRQLCDEPGIAQRIWVTFPKEVEGYIAEDVILSACGVRTPRGADDVYTPLADRLRILGVTKSYTKVELAKLIADRELSLDRFDLRRRLDELVTFILRCRESGVEAGVEALPTTSPP